MTLDNFKEKMTEKEQVPKELELLAVEARKYETAEEFARDYPNIFDRLQEQGIITDNYIIREVMLQKYGAGKKGLTDFYDQATKEGKKEQKFRSVEEKVIRKINVLRKK